MKAMILAAGVGERMLPLTAHTPKPLLRVGDQPLIEQHLIHLAAAGFDEVLINVSHLGAQIEDYCGDGARWNLTITYSREAQPLETAGGIFNALPLLGNAPFLVVNGDIWFDAPFDHLREFKLQENSTAHLLLVDNPPQHPQGDFHLDASGKIQVLGEGGKRSDGLTYAGVGIYSSAFFAGMSAGKLPLRPLLDRAIGAGQLSGEYSAGEWHDVGTPDRLRELDVLVQSRRS